MCWLSICVICIDLNMNKTTLYKQRVLPHLKTCIFSLKYMSLSVHIQSSKIINKMCMCIHTYLCVCVSRV